MSASGYDATAAMFSRLSDILLNKSFSYGDDKRRALAEAAEQKRSTGRSKAYVGEDGSVYVDRLNSQGETIDSVKANRRESSLFQKDQDNEKAPASRSEAYEDDNGKIVVDNLDKRGNVIDTVPAPTREARKHTSLMAEKASSDKEKAEDKKYGRDMDARKMKMAEEDSAYRRTPQPEKPKLPPDLSPKDAISIITRLQTEAEAQENPTDWETHANKLGIDAAALKAAANRGAPKTQPKGGAGGVMVNRGAARIGAPLNKEDEYLSQFK